MKAKISSQTEIFLSEHSLKTGCTLGLNVRMYLLGSFYCLSARCREGRKSKGLLLSGCALEESR